jgi:hypothetical protein
VRMLIFKNDSLKTRCNTIIWVKKTLKNFQLHVIPSF